MTASHPGRPRDQKLDDRLLDAAATVFMERGYHAASIAEIARRAGVGTPALYRRWPTKSALAIDMYVKESEPQPIPDTGSIRADLVAFLRLRLRQIRSRIMHKVLLPVIVESTADPALASTIATRFLAYRQPMVERLARAVKAGQLRAGVNPYRVVDNLMGTVYMPLLFSIDIPSDADAPAIVDQVLQGAKPRPRR